MGGGGAAGGTPCRGMGVPDTLAERALAQGLDYESGKDFAKRDELLEKVCPGDFYIQGKYPGFKAGCVCL